MGSNANIYLPSSNYGKTSCNLKIQKTSVIPGQSYTVMGKLEITGFSSGWKGWIDVYDKHITGTVASANISSDNNTFSLALEEGEYYFLFGLIGDVENEEVLLSYVLDGETLTLKPVPDVDFDSLTPLVVNRNIDLGKLICDISGDIIHVSFTVKMPLDIDGYFWIWFFGDSENTILGFSSTSPGFYNAYQGESISFTVPFQKARYQQLNFFICSEKYSKDYSEEVEVDYRGYLDFDGTWSFIPQGVHTNGPDTIFDFTSNVDINLDNLPLTHSVSAYLINAYGVAGGVHQIGGAHEYLDQPTKHIKEILPEGATYDFWFSNFYTGSSGCLACDEETGSYYITHDWSKAYKFPLDKDIDFGTIDCKDIQGAVPGADFTADQTEGTCPLTVKFTDQSTGEITSWFWEFGDGETSTEQNPTHTYNSTGYFTVSLTVTGPGGSDTETKENYIHVTEVATPGATSISQSQSDGTEIPEGDIIPEGTIVFKATLEDPDGDDVRLEIELRKIDEPFTGEPTPETISHFVPSGSEVTITRSGLVDGEYHWQYRVKDFREVVSEWKEFGEAGNVDFKVGPLRIISFTANPTTADTVPCEVSFTCKSNGIITEYRWDFEGDGVIDEITNANQTTHTYTEAGSYKASVTVVGDTGSTASKTRVIRVGDLLAKYAPILRFTNLPKGVTDPDFSGKELYFPTKVEEMAGNAQLVCDGKDCHLDLEDNYLSTYRKNWTADSCTIYGREVHQGNRTYLQYWFFYLFNDWENDHEGDWEMITIELDENKEPERIGYSRHHSGEVREWSDPEIEIKDGTHPVIYVGLGSHASYHKQDATPLGTYLGEIEILGGIDYHLGGGPEVKPGLYELPQIDEEGSHHWILIRDENLQWGADSGSPKSPTGQGNKWKDPHKWMDRLRISEEKIVEWGGKIGEGIEKNVKATIDKVRRINVSAFIPGSDINIVLVRPDGTIID